MRILVRLLIVSFLAAATSLQAITYIVPTDRDLVKRAEAIVIATAVESHSEITANGGLVTVARFDIERAVKGLIADHVDIVEPGGTVGSLSTSIPGSPRFENGKRYMLFLIHNNQGDWATYGFGLGRFEFVEDLHGRTILTRGDVSEGLFGFEEGSWAPHVERLRGGPEFLNFVDAVSASDSAIARTDYFLDHSQVIFESFPEFRPRATAFVPHTLATRPDYLFSGNYRWNGPTMTFDYCCVSKGLQPGLDGPGAVAAGTSSWTAAGANIHYAVGVNNESATGGLPSLGRGFSDNISAVLFNDPFNDYAASNVPAGVVGIGGISKAGSPSQFVAGDSNFYRQTTEGDVVIAKSTSLGGISQSTFNLVMTHELGHTLGFRHSDQTAADDPNVPCSAPLPCANPGQAVMASTIFSNLSGLQQWDLDAAQTVYGSGPVCTPPSIGTQPANTSITNGQQATLTVGATGTSLTYQWYIGTSGTTTTPAPGGTGTQLIVSPNTTTNYWVRVTGQCAPTADSRTAIVTVNCAPPSVPTPNASPSSISSGQSSTLSASPTGTPNASGTFTYQWYIGNSSDTSTPIAGATSSSTSVSPTVTTNYWVKVTGQCGTFNSPATTVSVACTPIALGGVGAQPPTINVGQSSTISVTTSGSGPFTFQWFRGSLGDFSNPIATTSSTLVSPTTSTTYWVRVTAPCGSQDGSVTVFVNAPCTASSITTNPVSPTIAPGASATLTVVAAGTAPISYQWFTGTSGNTSNPIAGATNASVTVTPSATTNYWVRVSNSCNQTGNNSTTAVVTVSAACPAPAITTQPASVSAGLGTAATLNVVATVTGTTIHYQWYKGAKGDLSTKVGTDSANFTTGAVAVTTSYWVRLTSACNNLTFTDSNAAIVTAVAAARGRAVKFSRD